MNKEAYSKTAIGSLELKDILNDNISSGLKVPWSGSILKLKSASFSRINYLLRRSVLKTDQ